MITAALGALIEWIVLRRIYRAPELFQLLATFALVLVVQATRCYGCGGLKSCSARAHRAQWLGSSVDWAARLPMYDLFLIVAGPVVLALLWLLLHPNPLWHAWCAQPPKTAKWSAPLGVNQAWLFTAVFALGRTFWPDLGGALAVAA